MNTCPVCGAPIVYDDSTVEHIICESYAHCKNCGLYDYKFAYGFAEIDIAGAIHNFDWQMSLSERMVKQDAIVLSVVAAKDKYNQGVGKR